MSGRAGFSDDFHQRVLFNMFNSSLNEDHVSDTPASSQHLQVKRNATPRDDKDYLLKSRKRRSKVWNDFRLDIKSDGKKKAICDHCNKEFVGESKKGTSHLLNHLKVCPVKRRKKEDENKPSENGNLKAHVVVAKKSTADLELSGLDLARSAIKRGGKTFIDDLLHVHSDEKKKLCESFTKLSCRVSLALDKVKNCVFLTVYYIDENWEMKRNICFFKDENYPEGMEHSLPVLKIDESLHSIVWPNSCDRDSYMKCLGDIPDGVPFGDNFKGFVSLQGYIDYVSHAKSVGAVSDIVKNMLGYDLYEKVDKALRYVQSVLYENDKHDLLTEIGVSLEEKKGGQSYFRTMMCALEYKEAFLALEDTGCDLKALRLTRDEWEVVTASCDCLKVLNNVTCSLSSTKYKTANSCIHLILNMYNILLQLGSNNSNRHSYMKNIGSHMRDNFVKGFWECNSLVLSIATFLDPRLKMDLVRGWYNIIYSTEVERHMRGFVDELKCIYSCYANLPNNPTSSMPITSDFLFGILEIDLYLRDVPLDLQEGNFEILAWWRNSTQRFPTLARMARDFLAVPICEVNSDTKDDIMKMDCLSCMDKWLAFEWAKFWLHYSHHEVQILENPPYHGQGITKTRQGNASSNCEMVSHTVRHNTSNTPHPKQTRAKWSKVWKECTLIPSSYERRWDMTCDDCEKNLTAKERHVHYRVCPAQRFFKEEENLGPFRRSDLTTLVDTKKKFKVDCELDGLDLARMTVKLGYTAFVDDLLRVYKEEKQKAVKYLNELSCSISLEYGRDGEYTVITVQFIDEVWKLQRKILYLDGDTESKLQREILYLDGDTESTGEFHCIGISPQELNAGRNLCSIIHSSKCIDEDISSSKCIDEDISRIIHLFQDPVFCPFSDNFRAIQSLRSYIDKVILPKGTARVRYKMKNILGCNIFDKIYDIYEYVHEKFPLHNKFGVKNYPMLGRYDHHYWGIPLEFREAFLKLEGTDLMFQSKNLTNKEWDALTAGYNCLKVFKDVISEHLSGKKYTTANVCLPLICDIYKRMQQEGSNNYYIHEFVEDLKETFVKDYWEGNGLALAIAAVLDPRFKMDVVEKWYNLIYGKEAEIRIQEFKEELRRCYNYYGDGSELDHYLRAPKRPIYADFKILTWWRDSTSQFPKLARMARDILAIPVLSDNSAMIDEIQMMCCDLQDLDIRNAFICTTSWLESLKDK